MPGLNATGGAIDERQRADIASQIVRGTLSIQDACTRYQLSREGIVEWLAEFRQSSLTAFDEQLRRTLADQGVDGSALSSAEFQGDLAELTLADLIQTLTLGRREGTIVVSHDGRESRIWCAGGEIVDAESGKLAGAAAVHRMLALAHGRVRASFTRVNRARKLNVSTMELLLDGARRSDEARAVRTRLGSGLYRLAAKALSVSDSLTEQEYSVLRQFDVPLSIRDVLAASELGDLETLILLSRLIAREYLLADGAARDSSPVRPSQVLSSPPLVLSVADSLAKRGARRWRGGALLGLAVLGFASWLVPRYLVGSQHRGPTLHSAPTAAALPFEPPAALPGAKDPVEPLHAPLPPATRAAPTRADAELDAPTLPRVAPAARKRATRAGVSESVSPAAALKRGPPTPAEPVQTTSTEPRMQIIDRQSPKMQVLE